MGLTISAATPGIAASPNRIHRGYPLPVESECSTPNAEQVVGQPRRSFVRDRKISRLRERVDRKIAVVGDRAARCDNDHPSGIIESQLLDAHRIKADLPSGSLPET